MHVDSMRFNLTKLVHLEKIVTRVTFLRFMYTIVCSIVNVIIENIKMKIKFDNETEINYIFKQLIDAVQLSVRQNINIIIINVINKRARFFDMYEVVFINIDSIMTSISIFVVKRLDYELLLKFFFSVLFI